MSKKYLLPCSCGRTIPVRKSQAGEKVHCPCGATLDVPTLRELSQLELAGTAGSVPKTQSTWGKREGRILLGGLAAATALVLAA